MTWLDIKNKKPSEGVEEKQFNQSGSFAEFLFSSGNGDLGSAEAIQLFYECKPFFQAVKKRSSGFASIKPRIWDVKEKVFVEDHPILTLLKHPNPFQSYQSFAMELAEFYDVTGNAFPLATGNVNRPPLELFNDRPQTINLNDGDTTFYFPNKITVNRQNTTQIFDLDVKRTEGISTARYFSQRDNEIWHIKDTNLSQLNTGLWGMSTALPIFLEIQQFIEANANNLSILTRGGRPSLGWSWTGDAPMTDAQFERTRLELKKYEGSRNAGKMAIIDMLKPEAIASTNKDMQFSENRRTVQEDIYNVYSIPLALISTNAMTLDNLKTSELLLWRDAILPLAVVLFGELTRFLLPRYGNQGKHKLENMQITFNPFDIEVLKAAKIREVTELQKPLILTDNELRTEIGYESLDEGGDSVWKPANLLPAEMDRDTSTNLTQPLSKSDNFIDQLKLMKCPDGSDMYSQEELDAHRNEGL